MLLDPEPMADSISVTDPELVDHRAILYSTILCRLSQILSPRRRRPQSRSALLSNGSHQVTSCSKAGRSSIGAQNHLLSLNWSRYPKVLGARIKRFNFVGSVGGPKD